LRDLTFFFFSSASQYVNELVTGLLR